MPEPLISRISASYAFEGNTITVIREHYTYKPEDNIGEFTLNRVLVNGDELGPGARAAIAYYVEEMRYHKLNFRNKRGFLINTMLTPRVEYVPPSHRKRH